MNKEKKIIIANWKMNLGYKDSLELANKIKKKFSKFSKERIVLCPDFISLKEVGKKLRSNKIELGAQDVFWNDYGAYTGEVCSNSLEEIGCSFVIIGHSERRQYLKESYADINEKIKNVLKRTLLTPIICIGENLDHRKKGRVREILSRQIKQAFKDITFKKDRNIIIAYEPLWAIGTGQTIKKKDMEEVNKIIVQVLEKLYGNKVAQNNFLKIYGGSVNSGNIKEFARIDGLNGFLVGGASLDAEEFYKISNQISD